MKTKKPLTASHFAWILGLFLTTAALPGFAQEVTIWDQTPTPTVTAEADTNPVEVGVKFRVTAPGHIIGLWFYKGLGNDGLHTGNLWQSDGTLLATIDFSNETATGWQRADFPAPVPVIAGQTYVVSYFAPLGNYAVDQSFFAAAGIVNGALTLLQDGIDGENGVYGYNAASIFPDLSYEASNYWVDPIYISADTDTDGDGILNANDNCPIDFNPGQEDDDLDGVGNVCDTVVGADSDNDGIEDGTDNCPVTPNTDQLDDDNDGIGNACEPDTDNDGVIDDVDNCPANANPGQEDSDSNGIGDACDFSSEPDSDTLGGLNCSIQQIAKYNGTQWVCSDEAQGPVGADGPQGPIGVDGPPGSKGDPGENVIRIAKYKGLAGTQAFHPTNKLTQFIINPYNIIGPLSFISNVDGTAEAITQGYYQVSYKARIYCNTSQESPKRIITSIIRDGNFLSWDYHNIPTPNGRFDATITGSQLIAFNPGSTLEIRHQLSNNESRTCRIQHANETDKHVKIQYIAPSTTNDGIFENF